MTKPHDDSPGWLVEESDLGRDILAEFPFDAAVDHVFELLNLGFLKLIVDRPLTPDPDATFAFKIELCAPPRPPSGQVQRPKRAGR